MTYDELVELLNKHSHNYYVLDNPTISDAEYDILFDTLLEMERTSGFISPSSPSRKVGGEPVKAFSQYNHRMRLYSLDKVQSVDELRLWHTSLTKALGVEPMLCLDYKLDGLTLSLTYQDGKFVRAATRGDGITGEDVTSQVLTIKTVPLCIPIKTTVEIQGEGIMRLSRFNEYNKTALEPLKNARNGAAGAIRNLDPKVTASRKLDIICYSINYMEEPFVSSQREMNDWLRSAGFLTAEPYYSKSIESLIKRIDAVDRTSLDYLTDGMVIKTDDLTFRKRLGYTDRFPKWAVAFKFEAEEKTTTLLDVEWNVGRSGKLTPLALLEPVDLCGATISRATLNNLQDIERKGVRIGSRVFIRRSNDVIPEITGVAETFSSDREILVPSACPSCSSPLQGIGAHIFCTNTEGCPKRVVSTLEYFCSKDCMDIEGFSSATAELLYKELGITSPCKLYNLTMNDLLSLDGFKQKKAENLLNAITASKAVSLDRFICALSIPNVGKKTAKDLAAIYGSIEAIRKLTVEELITINEVGTQIAESIVEFFKTNGDYVDALLKVGITPKTLTKNSEKLNGMRFVITGTLPSMPRDGMVQLIESNGGRISSTVSKETSYLITGEGGGSKLIKAQKLSIPCLTEAEFLKLIE